MLSVIRKLANWRFGTTVPVPTNDLTQVSGPGGKGKPNSGR